MERVEFELDFLTVYLLLFWGSSDVSTSNIVIRFPLRKLSNINPFQATILLLLSLLSGYWSGASAWNSLTASSATNSAFMTDHYSLDTKRRVNVHKTFRRYSGRPLIFLCTFNLRPVTQKKPGYSLKSENILSLRYFWYWANEM